MKIGAVDGIFGRLESEAELFRAARDTGMDGVELVIPSNFWSSSLNSEEHRMQLVRQASEKRMEISSILLAAMWSFTFANPDVRIRDITCDMIVQATDICRHLGAKVLLIPASGVESLDKKASTGLFVNGLMKCTQHAENSGVILGIENVRGKIVETAGDLLRIIDEVSSPAVKAYFDVGNSSWRGKNPVEELTSLKDCLAQVHLKDTPCNAWGKGNVNFEEVFKCLNEINYDGYLVFELPADRDRPVEAARELVDYVRTALRSQVGG